MESIDLPFGRVVSNERKKNDNVEDNDDDDNDVQNKTRRRRKRANDQYLYESTYVFHETIGYERTTAAANKVLYFNP